MLFFLFVQVKESEAKELIFMKCVMNWMRCLEVGELTLYMSS